METCNSFRVFIAGSSIADEALQKLGDEKCIIDIGAPTDASNDIARKLQAFNPDALIVRQGNITAEVLASAQNLRVICKHGTGTDNIDIAAASRAGIPVFSTPHANYEAVANHTLALIFALSRQIPLFDNQVRSGCFDRSLYGGIELGEKVLGLVGFGRIGRQVARLVLSLKMQVLTYSPSTAKTDLPMHVNKVASFPELLERSDIVSLHCPLTSGTRNLINSKSLSLMKSTAFLINTARGGIIDEHALLTALEAGTLAGAALDVFADEPPDPDNPLLLNNKIVFSPHVAGTSDRSLIEMGLAAVGHVLAVLKGLPIDFGSLQNRKSVEQKFVK